jgi:hypothetical protein
MVKKMNKSKGVNNGKRIPWTKAHEKELRAHSKSKTPVQEISRLMKRTAGSVRQKALSMGLGLGHRR